MRIKKQSLARWLVVTSCFGLSAAAIVPAAPLRCAQAPQAEVDVEQARAAARERLIEKLEELAEWCTKKKLYAARVGVYESLLHFDPQHVAAHRGLGYKKGREGEWLPPKQPKQPKDWDKSAAREFPEKRATLVIAYRDEMLALVEQLGEGADEATLAAIYADVLFANPDDEKVRELRGEVSVEGHWVLVQTDRAKARRGDLNAKLEAAFESAPKPEASEPLERELVFGIEWKAVFATPEVRSLGTGEALEVERLAVAMHATRHFFNSALGTEAVYPKGMTVYTLPRTSDKLAFLMGHPQVEAQNREFLLTLDGAHIHGSGDLAQWAPSEDRRLDGLVRLAIGWLLADTHSIGLQHGWVSEGVGLYLTHKLLGTRLTWFVRESKYLTPEEDLELKGRLMDSRANWMNEAHKLFSADKPMKLQFLLGKNVNQLTTEEMLYSYVLAAYLLEAEADKLAALLGKIGEGTTSQDAIQQVLGLDVKRLDERVRRWLSERR